MLSIVRRGLIKKLRTCGRTTISLPLLTRLTLSKWSCGVFAMIWNKPHLIQCTFKSATLYFFYLTQQERHKWAGCPFVALLELEINMSKVIESTIRRVTFLISFPSQNVTKLQTHTVAMVIRPLIQPIRFQTQP